MAKIKVYITGRDADINGNISVIGGKIVKAVPNYTEVFEEIPKTEHADVSVYGLIVDEEKICEVQEGERKLRLWEGPQGNRSFPQYRIMAQLVSLLDDEFVPAVAPADDVGIEKVKEANEGLLAKVGEMTREIGQLEEALAEAQTKLPGVKDYLRTRTEEELEAMPFIGPETVKHLIDWANETEG